MTDQVRFATSPDGVRIAYAVDGAGPALVKAGNWLTHLAADRSTPLWRHWIDGLSKGRTLIRYDERGSGLSDRDIPPPSLDDWVADLEAVIDSAGLDRFALVGLCNGGPVAIAYAARHPERVSKIVLYGTYARGRLHRDPADQAHDEADVLLSLTRVGWGSTNPAFRRVFTNLMVPGAAPEQVEWLEELQRLSTSPENALQSRSTKFALDVSEQAQAVRTPALVAHVRHDGLVPFEEGRRLASLIPHARFLPLDSWNHILLDKEPAWQVLLGELDAFLGPHASQRLDDDLPRPLDDDLPRPLDVVLSVRESQVIEHVSAGLTNDEIAAKLHLSPRTVERHLSNVYRKLGVSGKAARAAAAARFSGHRAR